MRSEQRYWGTENERLNVQVLYITRQPQKPPCFADSDTALINPERGEVVFYRYSRSVHRLVDIPEVRRLTPGRLQQMLKRTQMLVVLFDEPDPVTSRIIKTIPFVANSRLRLSVLAEIGKPSTRSPSNLAEQFTGYHCLFAAEQQEEAHAVTRMLIEACTVQSPVSTDIADVQHVLKGAKSCEVCITSDSDPAVAATKAMNRLEKARPLNRLFCALVASPSAPGLEAPLSTVDVVKPCLAPDAGVVTTLQLDSAFESEYQFVIIASEHEI